MNSSRSSGTLHAFTRPSFLDSRLQLHSPQKSHYLQFTQKTIAIKMSSLTRSSIKSITSKPKHFDPPLLQSAPGSYTNLSQLHDKMGSLNSMVSSQIQLKLSPSNKSPRICSKMISSQYLLGDCVPTKRKVKDINQESTQRQGIGKIRKNKFQISPKAKEISDLIESIGKQDGKSVSQLNSGDQMLAKSVEISDNSIMKALAENTLPTSLLQTSNHSSNQLDFRSRKATWKFRVHKLSKALSRVIRSWLFSKLIRSSSYKSKATCSLFIQLGRLYKNTIQESFYQVLASTLPKSTIRSTIQIKPSQEMQKVLPEQLSRLGRLLYKQYKYSLLKGFLKYRYKVMLMRYESQPP